MKNIIILLICTIFFSSCSLSTSEAPATPVAPLINTPTTAPSATATVPTPTFTGTPTLIIHPKTNTPTSAALITQITQAPIILITSDTLTPIPKINGFVSILVSEKEFYKGKKCLPASVKFTAQVSEPGRSAYVVLFVRFKSKRSGVTSEWTSLQMDNKGAGTFTHDLISLEMIGETIFFNAWVEYQLVTTQSNTRVIGRTDIFSGRLSLLECNPTPAP